MCARSILRWVAALALLAAGPVLAQTASGWPSEQEEPLLKLKPAAVIYFTGGLSHGQDEIISRVVKRAGDELHLNVRDYPLKDEAELPQAVEKIADEEVGLIIIVAPRHIEAMMKLPSLYPDVEFSIIDIPSPTYLTNVHSLIFNDQEGAFLIGALAALHSRTGAVAVLSADDNDPSRRLAYAFLQGAKYARGDIEVVQQLGAKAHGKLPRAGVPGKPADIMFVLDDELLPPLLRAAHQHHQLVIPFGRDLTGGDVLTSLLKHYDLAIYATLQNYRQRGWKPGAETIGIGGGYLDYTLDDRNKALLPKETVDRVEMIKDLMSQRIIKIAPLE